MESVDARRPLKGNNARVHQRLVSPGQGESKKTREMTMQRTSRNAETMTMTRRTILGGGIACAVASAIPQTLFAEISGLNRIAQICMCFRVRVPVQRSLRPPGRARSDKLFM